MARKLLKPEPMAARQTRWLIASMAFAVAFVALLADWDQRREGTLALNEFAAGQATLAATVAHGLNVREPSLAPFKDVEREAERVLLLLPPGSAKFVTRDGRQLADQRLLQALAQGLTTLRLDRPEAASFGLPLRTAVAGLATVGGFGVAVVTTARNDRDREQRAALRLLLSTVLAAGLVVAFGGIALRERAKEVEASRSLALEQLAREREQRLTRESRAATMVTLASGMAHELGTPLGVIVGRAEQLEARARGDERATHAARTIIDQAQQIGEVMRGFLSFARGTPPALVSVAPSEVIAAALGLVEHRFLEAGVFLAARNGVDLPLVRCEPRLLGQALVNVLLNSCDACHAGSSVAFGTERRSAAVAFIVTDDGEGISAEVAARATEPFFTTKQDRGGTGLGLAIANEIVKTHRGELTITRNRDRGTCVVILIPVAKEAEANV
jgi:two-component system, NtrC family, sensor kinase